MNLEGCIKPVRDINANELAMMYQLMDETYENIKGETFSSDLHRKDHAILLYDQGVLSGFSTLAVYTIEVCARPTTIVFSGDTVIDKAHWGSLALPRLGLAYGKAVSEGTTNESYWFLMSKGYRTYRFLPAFFNTFYPSDDHDEKLIAVRDAFAQTFFPQAYSSATGLISYHGSKDYLRKGIADITAKELKNRHIRRFVQRNPNWHQGDELACVARLSCENFTSIAKKLIDSGRPKVAHLFSRSPSPYQTSSYAPSMRP